MEFASILFYAIIVAASYTYAFKKSKKDSKKAVKKGGIQFLKQLPFLVAIFLLIGLFNEFVPQSLVVALIGKGKGLLSIVSSALLGTVVMAPVSSAYPLGALLLKKGATITAVAIFLNTWVMVGFVTMPYEMSLFGKRFAVTRNILAFIGAIIIGVLTGLVLGGGIA